MPRRPEDLFTRGAGVTASIGGPVGLEPGQSVDLLRALGEPHRLACALALLAEAELGLTERAAARASATEALRIARRVGYRPAIGLALTRLGDLALARRDTTGAERFYEEALDHVSGAPDTARTLERLAAARVAAAPEEAGRLLDCAGGPGRRTRPPAPPAEHPLIDAVRQATR